MTVIEKLDMNVKQANSDFVAIKNKIVEKGVEVADGTRTAEYADKVGEVYEAGKKSQYDEFWDVLQDYGNRTAYGKCFAQWVSNCFYPKYDIRMAGNCLSAFQDWSGDEVDLAARLQECGVVLDTSEATDLAYAFISRVITRLPKIDTRGANTLNTTFANSIYHTIDEIVLREDGSQTFTTPFDWSVALVNLTISGKIGANGFDMRTNTSLSKASITSIINALSDTTSGLSITLSRKAKEAAFPDTDTVVPNKQWIALINTKPNWTINLI